MSSPVTKSLCQADTPVVIKLLQSAAHSACESNCQADTRERYRIVILFSGTTPSLLKKCAVVKHRYHIVIKFLGSGRKLPDEASRCRESIPYRYGPGECPPGPVCVASLLSGTRQGLHGLPIPGRIPSHFGNAVGRTRRRLFLRSWSW